jgi:hypothetical protein
MRPRFRRPLAALIATLVIAPAAALAQSYTIPPGPLGPALKRFAAEAGVTLEFEPALVEGKTSARVTGSPAVEQGFSELLRGSGLELRRSGARYVLGWAGVSQFGALAQGAPRSLLLSATLDF